MTKITAPKMAYILGEEMTRYGMSLILDQWINPHLDTSSWQFFDLSAKNRDDTQDQILTDVVEAGKEIRVIFKEPTVTPTADQAKAWGLSKAWGSPNGAMRRGWNGISISRDTIMVPGVELGYKKPVLFDRHAVGGEYGAAFAETGAGRAVTTFYPDDGGESITIVDRQLSDSRNALVTYHNPLDNVEDLAHHFFARSLSAGVTPYVTTKKTVFKWQEPFWQIMKDIFDAHYKEKFIEKGLLDSCHNELTHIISDAACMKLPAWTSGGFAMVAHNYDGDMLTDLMGQIHRSAGFVSSVLVGKADDGTIIKEFEASHGTVSDMYRRHKEGQETSLNPLGMAYALLEAIDYSAELSGGNTSLTEFTSRLRNAMYSCMQEGKATRDMVGPQGLTTEGFVEAVAAKL